MTDGVWPLLLGVLGAVIGSFVAVVAIRWPAGRSALAGRSTCDACGHVVRVADLVPLVSFAWRRGRCRDCDAPIDRRHPAIEGAAAAIGIAAGLAAPGWDGVWGAAFGWLLLALAALDLAAWWLPDRLVALLAATGVASALAGAPPAMAERLIGGVAGFVGLEAVRLAYRRLRHREGMGGGDPKLLGAIGVWLGWRPLPAVLLLACVIGLAVVGWRAAGGRTVTRHDAVPLGALLAAAAYPAWLAMLACVA